VKNEKIYAYTGKILRIDLSTGVIATEPTIKYIKKWLGGRGIGQWIMYKEVKPWITPFEPANRITIETGPFNGTLVPGACRSSLSSKNVFSHGVGVVNVGGHFAPELKFAGYDLVVIQGKSRKPVYLWIDDDCVELRSAEDMWGRTTWETDDFIKTQIGDESVQVISIGPAGENLVKAACVIGNRNRAAARCGLGAIFGSKNLKAVAVRGTGSIEVAQPERFMETVDVVRDKIDRSPFLNKESPIRKYGTDGIFIETNEANSIPYKNFQDVYIPPESARKLDPEFILKYKVRDFACFSCPVSCSQFLRIDKGPYAGLATEGIELEDAMNFGGKLAIDEPQALIKAHSLCNQLGLDQDNATGAISWAFECYQRGILRQKDTDGLKLEWGNYEVVFELLRKMAYREGFGNLLAEGSRHASEIIGKDSGYYAITMKGQELFEETRMPIGWGLGVCLATRAGGHTTATPQYEMSAQVPEIREIAKRVLKVETFEPTSYKDKPKLVIHTERYQELMHCLGTCITPSSWMDPEIMSLVQIAELYSAATGWETGTGELIAIADRVLNLEKAFNVLHAGLSRRDDYPPDRCLREPIKSGPFKGFALSKEEYDKMLDEYYQLRGWDPSTGLQTRKCLEDVDLEMVADDLQRAGGLPFELC
jgi:aldehyde:ferredoxin oxidoreductase